jgi:hypothetical protein
MRIIVALLVIALIAVLLAVGGPSLPEGNFLRGLGESIRGVGDAIGRGFGGGYGELTP